MPTTRHPSWKGSLQSPNNKIAAPIRGAGRHLWDSGLNGRASGPISLTWCRFESGLSRLHSHPSGAGFPLSSRRLRGSRPCGCTSPETGNDLLSSFPRPAKAGHMVGVAQRKSGGLQNRVSRVRIPPRPPRRIRCAGCQKWESPNLSSADSRQRPPAGVILPGGYMGK